MIDKIRPLYDRVLVQRCEIEEKKSGGIIIPDAAKEKGQTGKVIAVGEGRRGTDGHIHPLRIKAGDKILFTKYAGTETVEDHIILREDDILAVIK